MAAPISSSSGVLRFWFGEAGTTCDYFDAHWPRWFGGRDVLFDVAQRASVTLIRALAGSSPDATWDSPRGKLARIIALDQFSRCAFRGTPEAFAHDKIACRLARELAESGAFDELLPVERFFVCVALSHAEDAADNQLHVELAARIGAGAPADVAAFFASLNGFPHEHAECIKRFGRFPHRNALLGRESRPEELAWLRADDCPGWARSQRPATLTYWRGRGLGDPVRFLLEFALVPFDEVHVDSAEAFAALKSGQKLAFGQVPLLEIDGLCLVQTQAILRHVARKKGLEGATARAKALADMVVNAVMDARQMLITAHFQDGGPADALASFGAGPLPRLCGELEAVLAQQTGPYIAGELTCARATRT